MVICTEPNNVYSTLTAFLRDAEVLHAAQLEQASHERAIRFSGRVVQSHVQGRLTSVGVWIEPSTLSRLVSFGLEVGGGVAIAAGTPPKLGYVTHLNVEDGLLDVSLADLDALPRNGAVVHGEIRPLEFLVLQESEALARASADFPDRMARLLSPQAPPVITKCATLVLVLLCHVHNFWAKPVALAL